MSAAVPELDAEILAHFHVIGMVGLAAGRPGAFIKDTETGVLTPLSLGITFQHFGADAHA